MKRASCSGLGLAAFLMTVLLVGHPVSASSPDVGLVTGVTGNVLYWDTQNQTQPLPVQAFMKVRFGDRFKVPPQAKLQIIYAATGRQESWHGPVVLKAGRQMSQIIEGTPNQEPREIKTVPREMPEKILEGPLPLPRSRLRYSGVFQTMGPKQKSGGGAAAGKALDEQAKRTIQAAQAAYRHSRQQASPEDMMPELYLLSVLAKYGQYAQMDDILNRMLRKRPGDPALLDCKRWLQQHRLADPCR
jgi:hypothetical protein